MLFTKKVISIVSYSTVLFCCAPFIPCIANLFFICFIDSTLLPYEQLTKCIFLISVHSFLLNIHSVTLYIGYTHKKIEYSIAIFHYFDSCKNESKQGNCKCKKKRTVNFTNNANNIQGKIKARVTHLMKFNILENKLNSKLLPMIIIFP